ncbi:MAG: YARHG domain-containing protein [Abitibacteriaceae bacterium]|nr:YARHG domain-containing protein [Abditibacteriaceae bacterium]MBV9867870.1 YARHG domain-containing protein [Abditibacteriaceae bacterium]
MKKSYKRLVVLTLLLGPVLWLAPSGQAQLARHEGWAGEHYPQTRLRALSWDEVADWSPAQVRYAVNEMYARHGFVFKDLALRKQFLQYGWYKPIPGLIQKQVEAHFNHYERENLRVLSSSHSAGKRTVHEAARAYPGEHFPETHTRLIRRSEVAAWTSDQVRYAINEMYARHGLVFKDMDIRKQFLQFKWYRPVPGRTQQQAEADFNHYERENLKVLSAARKDAP